eukprot:5104102-Lingulodinium_polyedra.AAC.1
MPVAPPPPPVQAQAHQVVARGAPRLLEFLCERGDGRGGGGRSPARQPRRRRAVRDGVGRHAQVLECAAVGV